MKNLKTIYENVCNAYLEAFCDKHGYILDEAYWIADDVGGVVEVSDYFVSMDTIRKDIDMNAPDDEFWKWYDYGTRLHTIAPDTPSPNFENWLQGCPRKSEDELQELERLHERVEEARAALENAMNPNSNIRRCPF